MNLKKLYFILAEDCCPLYRLPIGTKLQFWVDQDIDMIKTDLEVTKEDHRTGYDLLGKPEIES